MNDIVQWDPNSGAALPAYLQQGLAELGTNIPDRNTTPSLSYEGKVWTIVENGNKEKLQVRNQDGDMVPVQIMRAIILKFNADRGRAYYPGVYNPAQSSQPDCWSADGKTSNPGSKNRVSVNCNGCPMSVKGSKVQDGKEMVACSSHRMIALAPAFEIERDPLRLKLAVTSDYDKEVVEHGWFAFRQYSDYLKSKGITHTAMVVTKMKFDAQAPHPKVLFAMDRPVTPEEYEQVKRALANPKVDELLAEKWSAAGVNGVAQGDKDLAPHGLEGAMADGWLAHPDAAGYFYKGQEVLQGPELALRYPAPVAAPPPVIPAAQQVIEHAPPVVPAAPAPVAVAPIHDPLSVAKADGWVDHPDAPDYMYKGSDVKLRDEVVALYPAAAAPAPEPAAPPPPPPAPAPAPVVVDPMEAARADGWIAHPDAAGYHYKGSDVKLDAEVVALYAGNGTATAAPTPPTPAPAAAEPTGASPSSPAPTGSAEVPAEVQDLLSKWAS